MSYKKQTMVYNVDEDIHLQPGTIMRSRRKFCLTNEGHCRRLKRCSGSGNISKCLRSDFHHSLSSSTPRPIRPKWEEMMMMMLDNCNHLIYIWIRTIKGHTKQFESCLRWLKLLDFGTQGSGWWMRWNGMFWSAVSGEEHGQDPNNISIANDDMHSSLFRVCALFYPISCSTHYLICSFRKV